MEQELRWIRQIQKKRSVKEANLLVSCYYDEIYAYSYRQVGDKEAAMDITQEIFIAVLQSIERFDCRKGNFRAWLYRIATNKIIDSRRKKRVPLIPLGEAEFPDVGEEFIREVERQGLIQKIEAYVSGLDIDTQQVFRLHLFGEYSFPEIARLTGREEAAVKSRYYRLLNTLRKEFEHEYSLSKS